MRCNLCMSAFGALVAFSSTALAADLPPRPAYKGPPVVVAYNWTGLYVGAHAGYGWSKFSGTDLSFGDSSTGKAKGPLGGLQIGYNYQINWLVLGVEGEYSFANVKISIDDPLGIGAPGGNATLKNDFFATAAVRAGYAFDRALIYAKGGAAWTRDKLDITDGIGGTATGRFDRTGWLVGAGFEYGFLGNWSAKVEYDYMQFGSITEHLTTGGGLTATDATVKLNTQVIKAGINYRFF